MPNDYLLGTGGRPSQWMKLHNNDTGTDYFSTSWTDANGMFVHSAPPGKYTTYTSALVSLPPAGDPSWGSTGNTGYLVAASAGDDLVMRSLTVKSSSPYAPSAAAGRVDAILGDWGGDCFNPRSSLNPSGAAKGDYITDDTIGITSGSPAITSATAGLFTGRAGETIAVSDGTSTAIATPAAPTLKQSQVGGGTLGAATYAYRISALSASGETVPGTETTLVVAAGSTLIDISWPVIPWATGYKVYGRTSGTELLLGSSTQNAFRDVGSLTPSGAMPGANTAFQPLITTILSVTDGTHATLNANALTTKSNVHAEISADDSASVQAALNAANTVGSGKIRIQGTFGVKNLTLYRKLKLEGGGIEGSILKLLPGANTNLISTNNFAALTGGGTTGGEFNFTLLDITLDGNKAYNATAGDMLRIYGYGYVFRAVRIRNGRANGLYSEWAQSGPSPGNDSMEAAVSDLKVHDCDGDGIQFAGPHDSQFVNVVSYNNNGKNFWIKLGGGSHFTTCHGWGITATYGWYLEDTCNLVNSEGEGASVANLLIGKSDCVVFEGNYFGGAAGMAASIQIGDGSHAGVGGVDIYTKVVAPVTGANAVQFNNGESANRVRLLIYMTAGTPIGGTGPDNSDTLEFQVNGGAAAQYVRFPTATIIQAGAFTVVGGPIVALQDIRRSRQTPTEAVLVSGITATSGEIISVTLTAARLVGAPLSPVTGQNLTFEFTQGGAGGFTVTWNAVFKKTWADTGNTTGKISSISFYYNGTNWVQTGAQAPYV